METKPLGHNVDLAERAYRIRRNALLMGEVQGQGYIGQALDTAQRRTGRRVFSRHALPPGRSSLGRARLLSACRTGITRSPSTRGPIEAGIVPEEELEPDGSDGSRLPMSGMAAYTPGMEMSGGSLGLGLSIGVGMCLE